VNAAELVGPNTSDEPLAAAAYLADELHATTNRVERLLRMPGAPLPVVRIDAATALSRVAAPGLLRTVIGRSARRLAERVEAMSDAKWRLGGTLASTRVTVGDLVTRPLHTAHRLRRQEMAPLGGKT
jgi:hypothetical protein